MITEDVRIVNVWAKHYPYRRWYDANDKIYKTEKAHITGFASIEGSERVVILGKTLRNITKTIEEEVLEYKGKLIPYVGKTIKIWSGNSKWAKPTKYVF